ncbi:hypothetical protein [Nostoc sp.]
MDATSILRDRSTINRSLYYSKQVEALHKSDRILENSVKILNYVNYPHPRLVQISLLGILLGT